MRSGILHRYIHSLYYQESKSEKGRTKEILHYRPPLLGKKRTWRDQASLNSRHGMENIRTTERWSEADAVLEWHVSQYSIYHGYNHSRCHQDRFKGAWNWRTKETSVLQWKVSRAFSLMYKHDRENIDDWAKEEFRREISMHSVISCIIPNGADRRTLSSSPGQLPTQNLPYFSVVKHPFLDPWKNPLQSGSVLTTQTPYPRPPSLQHSPQSSTCSMENQHPSSETGVIGSDYEGDQKAHRSEFSRVHSKNITFVRLAGIWDPRRRGRGECSIHAHCKNGEERKSAVAWKK